MCACYVYEYVCIKVSNTWDPNKSRKKIFVLNTLQNYIDHGLYKRTMLSHMPCIMQSQHSMDCNAHAIHPRKSSSAIRISKIVFQIIYNHGLQVVINKSTLSYLS